MFRTTSVIRRVLLALCASLLLFVLVLPRHSRGLLQAIGVPLADIVSLPLELFSEADRRAGGAWDHYVALRNIHEENQQLKREIEFLHGQVADLRELASANHRLGELLKFQGRTPSRTVAAQVLGRDATNWYQGVILDKGARDGIEVEMSVITPTGAVGRVVKTTATTAVVLLITDPNNAVPALVQRTRDEGLIEGTRAGKARLKYIPLLSTVRVGDPVVTSGLTGKFPKGVPIGTITRIEKEEGVLFQAADVEPEVDFTKLEEVLVVTTPRAEEPAAPAAAKGAKPS
ncbi:MAG: rod shape-determining protein MreC [Nitrospira sp.]|nr:rod shape-determining protein MreC [Nitrospira sp.]